MVNGVLSTKSVLNPLHWSVAGQRADDGCVHNENTENIYTCRDHEWLKADSKPDSSIHLYM